MTPYPISKKIAYLAFLISLSLIFSYVESLIPINIGVPGIKIGLANIVSVISLYLFGLIPTIIIVTARVLLAGFMFGNANSIIYALCGGLISLLMMGICKKINKLSIFGVSMCGGVFHNIGQLLVAMLVVKQLKLSYYGPVLIVAGLIMGGLIGYISSETIKRVETYVR